MPKVKGDWQNVKDGQWATGDGETIHSVDPRGGKRLYVRNNALGKGVHPRWYDSLREAKADKADQ